MENNFELKKEDWVRCKVENLNLIKMNKIQIEMASEVLKLCEKKIKLCPTEITSKEETKSISSEQN